jgi:hypothetical protein
MSQKEIDKDIEDRDGSIESNIDEEKVDQIEDLIVESFEEKWIESSEIDASLRSKGNRISERKIEFYESTVESKDGDMLERARGLSTPSNETEESLKDSIPSSKAEEAMHRSVFTSVNEMKNIDSIPISSPRKTVQVIQLDMVAYVYIYVYIHMNIFNSMQIYLYLYFHSTRIFFNP